MPAARLPCAVATKNVTERHLEASERFFKRFAKVFGQDAVALEPSAEAYDHLMVRAQLVDGGNQHLGRVCARVLMLGGCTAMCAHPAGRILSKSRSVGGGRQSTGQSFGSTATGW